MPLPPALAARLAARGIVNKEQVVQEEIIAEDYDDQDSEGDEPPMYEYDEPVRKRKDNPWTENIKKRLNAGQISGYNCCPNKYNIYHKCTLYCATFWSGKERQPTEEYFLRKKRLLKRFPLPKNWIEVFDIGCAAHYYWNTVDDVVSWLPPSHPASKVSKSAAMVRREMEMEEEERDPDQQDTEEQHLANVPLPPTTEPPPPILANISLPPPPVKKSRNRDLEKVIRNKHERPGRYRPPENVDVLDPMDPAAYSDIPRGKWSDGLEQENKRGGVDSTVTGTAFQQRPYPSPGAILAAQRKRKNSDDDDADGDREAEDHSDDDDDDDDGDK